MTEYQNTSTKFDDLCDDVIDIILCCLKLEDLTNVSDTNKRLRTIACSVFSRNHANQLISIDCFDPSDEIEKWDALVSYKNKSIVRVADAKVRFKLLRNFGNLIKYIRIQVRGKDGFNIPTSWRNVNNYLIDYCVDFLEVLELYTDTHNYFVLDKTLLRLQQFFGHAKVMFKTVELMPNLNKLSLWRVPQTLKRCFPKLENVKLVLATEDAVHSFVSFMEMNNQIKVLNLQLHLKSCHDLIFSSIVENLPQLKTMEIFVLYELDTTERIYRFDSIDTLILWNCKEAILKSFHFKCCLKELSLSIFVGDTFWVSFVLRHKKLKVLTLSSAKRARENGRLRLLLNELLDLEKLKLFHLVEKENRIVKKILGSEWGEPIVSTDSQPIGTFSKLSCIKPKT